MYQFQVQNTLIDLTSMVYDLFMLFGSNVCFIWREIDKIYSPYTGAGTGYSHGIDHSNDDVASKSPRKASNGFNSSRFETMMRRK